jgi:hypothetical protein
VATTIITAALGDLRSTAPWLEVPGRPQAGPDECRILVEDAREHGHVDLLTQAPAPTGIANSTAGPGLGAAVWFHSDHGPWPVAPQVAQRLQVAGETPHHYLVVLAAVPGDQREGIATTLLEHHHRDLSGSAVATWLVASSDDQQLYGQLGYRPLGTPLPGEPVTFTVMRRPPLAGAGGL